MKKYFAVPLAALFVAFSFVTAQAATVTVDVAAATNGVTATGVYVEAGQEFSISATGTVNLAPLAGNYVTDANGTIVTAPTKYATTWPIKIQTAAYSYFSGMSGGALEAGGSKLVPYIGLEKDILGGQVVSYGGANFGALIGLFAYDETSARKPTDFTSAMVLGNSGTFSALTSGWFYLLVNDTIHLGNSGKYSVAISTVPLPAALPLFGAGLLALAYRRRKA